MVRGTECIPYHHCLPLGCHTNRLADTFQAVNPNIQRDYEE